MIFWISFYSFPNICSHLRIDMVFRQISLLIEGHFLSLFFFPCGIHLFPNPPLPPIRSLSAILHFVPRQWRRRPCRHWPFSCNEGRRRRPWLGRSVDAIRGSHGRSEGRRRHFPEALDPSLRPSVRSLGPRRTLARQTFPERDFPSMQSVRQSIFAMIAAILEELNLCLVSHSRVEKD